MKKKVTAGVIDDAGGLLKQLANTFFKGLDALIDHGLKVKNQEVTDDGGWRFTAVIPKKGRGKNAKVKSFEIDIKCKPVDGDDALIDMYFKGQDGKEKTVEGVKKSNYQNVITTTIADMYKACVDTLYDEKKKSYIWQSNRLDVTLQRVCASTGDTIHLTAINANYAATKALEDLDAVLSDDAFVSEITEEPVSYSIVDEGETFDVNRIAEVNAMDGLRKILCGAFNLMHTAQCVCWNAKGDDFHELRAEANDLAWSLYYQIDTIAELCVEFNGFAPHPNTCTYPDCSIDPNTGFTKSDGLNVLRNAIEFYIGELEGYRCNFPADVQAKIDEWVRNIKHRSRYTINQIQKI